mmetsp:Transcript_5361/g.20234  ORF Transcript_5361/g.20234 Transcript_5361/m.20234 type:complete len:211 (+) Transcript_5361:1936-2568(+)
MRFSESSLKHAHPSDVLRELNFESHQWRPQFAGALLTFSRHGSQIVTFIFASSCVKVDGSNACSKAVPALRWCSGENTCGNPLPPRVTATARAAAPKIVITTTTPSKMYLPFCATFISESAIIGYGSRSFVGCSTAASFGGIRRFIRGLTSCSCTSRAGTKVTNERTHLHMMQVPMKKPNSRNGRISESKCTMKMPAVKKTGSNCNMADL